MTKRHEPVHPRQFGPAAAAVDEFLRGIGCSEITFYKAKHVKVEAQVGPKTIRFSLPCTPRDDTAAAKQAVRQARRKVAEACASTEF